MSSKKETCWGAAPTQTTCCLQLQVRTQQHVKSMHSHTGSTSTHNFIQAWSHDRQTVHTISFHRIIPNLEMYQTI